MFLGFLITCWVFFFDQDRVYPCPSQNLTLRAPPVQGQTWPSAIAQPPPSPWTLPFWQWSRLALAFLTFMSHCGFPLSLLSMKSPKRHPVHCSLATSPPSHVQFDFWTQVQDPPFIPIKFHLVRFRLLFQLVEIVLNLGPVGCLPLCSVSSVNLISIPSMSSSKSSMGRLGSTEARTWPSRSLEIALLVTGDQSVSIHWVLSFIQVPVHWATLSSSPHFSIKSIIVSEATLSNVLLIPRYPLLGHPFISSYRETDGIDKYGLRRAGFLQEGGGRVLSFHWKRSSLKLGMFVCFAPSCFSST